ncbi:MAG: 4Fe-4S cluster-binding domain-containing protein [bacterium]
MFISELFSSIQGEGSFAGLPAFFIRFSGCNLSCPYCDTKGSRCLKDGAIMTPEEIISTKDFSFFSDICISGGEPMCQSDALCSLLEAIPDEKRVSIETNGSFSLEKLREKFPDVYLSVDWKLPSSGSDSFKMENLNCIAPRGWLKLVVSDDKDLNFIEKNKTELSKFSGKIFISPVSRSSKKQFKKISDFVIEKQNIMRLRIQFQLHKIMGIS